MVVVNIAQLKNKLSSYLNRVRRGEEVVIKDRETPIARILPLDDVDIDEEERELVAAGLLRLPKKKWDPDRFFAIGRNIPEGEVSDAAIREAVDFAKEDVSYAGVLGRKHNRTHLRSRSKKR
jgi:prevent-host-death family protein